MAGMLTVVNPRRRRRSTKRKSHKAAKPRRRRARAANPARRPRRRRHHARRHVAHRRRRHSNPSVRMGSIVGVLTKGLAVGAGAVATNLATNALNHATGNKLTGPVKLAAKAAVGLVALPMLLKFIPGGKKFAAQVAMGAGVAVALDIYEQYVKANVPAYLQDYHYGSLNAYEQGSLNGWAPQQGMSGWLPQEGGVSGVYDGGVYGD